MLSSTRHCLFILVLPEMVGLLTIHGFLQLWIIGLFIFIWPSKVKPMFCRLRSSLWLQFKPHHIAAGAAYLAAKILNLDVASYQYIWQEFQTTPAILQGSWHYFEYHVNVQDFTLILYLPIVLVLSILLWTSLHCSHLFNSLLILWCRCCAAVDGAILVSMQIQFTSWLSSFKRLHSRLGFRNECFMLDMGIIFIVF